MTTLGDRIAAAKRHPGDLTYSEWVELLELPEWVYLGGGVVERQTFVPGEPS